MSDPKDVVRRFFDTLGTGNFAAIGEFFTDDSVWQVNDMARRALGCAARFLLLSGPVGDKER